MTGNLSSKAKKLLQGLAILSGILLAVYSSPADAACAGPVGAAGKIIYNSAQKVLQYCDDTDWIAMNPVPGSGSGGCAAPAGNEGAIIYNEDQYMMQVCAGNVWKGIGPAGGSRTNEWQQVEGGNTVCGIKTDNTLWCWGYSAYLGNGVAGYTTEYSPIQIGTAKWKMISLGAYIGRTACGIQMDDSLWCWGEDTQGQQGDGATVGPQYSPHKIGSASWKFIDASDNVVCGIQSDDSLWCWGYDGNGQVGDGGGAVNQTSPVQIGTDTWKFVSAAEANGATCGIKTDDSMWCWGNDSGGQVGNGATTGNQFSPVAVAAGTTWKSVSGLVSSMCGIKTNDSLWCWGADSFGEQGNGAGGSQNAPGAVNDGGATWKYIKGAGHYHYCAIKTDDTLWCWGWNYTGMTGQGTEAGNTTSPAQVSGGGTWLDVGLASASTCGIKSSGKMACFGVDFGEPLNTFAPVPVAGGYKWQKIETGGYYYNGWDEHACGIRTDGVMMCWGGNEYGQLGDNLAEEIAYSPITVSGGYTWADVDLGSKNVCGIRTNGTAMCWGAGGNGSLGNGTNTSIQPTPVTVSGGYTWQQISGGSTTYCGLRTNGVAMCWGYGPSGQLGNGANSNSNVPVTVSGGYTWQMVSADSSHACGIRTDGVAMCWGNNSNYQLGTGNTTNSNVPVTVMGGYTWKYISAGYEATCGVRTDGVAMCWGYDENWNTLTTPTLVSGTDTWMMALSGVSDPDTRCGIKSDGTAWCIGWLVGDGDEAAGNGYNGYYVEVHGGSHWKQIATGDEFMCGVTTNDNGYCWGYDWIGQLGYGGGGPVLIPSENTECNDPLAEPGEMVYNVDHNVMQYCDGSGWFAIGK